MKILLKIFPQLNSLFEESHINEIIRGSTTTLLLRVSGFFLSFLFTMVVAKYYGVEALGVLAIAVSILKISSALSLLGIHTAIIRQIARYALYGRSVIIKIYRKTGILVTVLSLFLGGILYWNSAWIAIQIFGKEELTVAIKIVSIVLPFKSLNAINTASLTGLKRITESFSLQLVFPPLLNLALLVVLTNIISNNFLIPVYAKGITAVISTMLTFYFWYHNLRKIPDTIDIVIKQPYKQDFSFKGLLKLSLPMFFSASMLVIMGAIDIIFLGIFSSTQNTGIYGVALKLALPVSFILYAINSISAPKFAELYHHNQHKELKRLVRFASKLSFFFSLPVVIMLIFIAQPILLFLGPSFQTGFIPFLILISGRLVSSYSGPNKIFLNMTDNHKLLGKILLFATVLNILLNIALIPPFGIIGAAIATSISIISLNIIISITIYKRYGYWINYIPKNIEQSSK